MAEKLKNTYHSTYIKPDEFAARDNLKICEN